MSAPDDYDAAQLRFEAGERRMQMQRHRLHPDPRDPDFEPMPQEDDDD